MLLLQQPQHLWLRRQRHVADFIEEERSVVGLLKLADAAAVGPGEGSFSWPNSSLSKQSLGNRGAVDRQEGPLPTRAVLINGAGDQFLACPAFTLDEYRHVERRNAANAL